MHPSCIFAVIAKIVSERDARIKDTNVDPPTGSYWRTARL
jgi:hypothetical protein